MPMNQRQRTQTILLTLVPLSLAGCRAPQPTADPQSPNQQHIVALVDDLPITFDQIQHDLSELAGKEALIDLVLDHQLEAELDHRNLQINPSDLDHERALFVRTIAGVDPKAPNFGLLDSIRASRGLGPDRYPRLIRRNAMLRALAADSAVPSDAEYQLAERIAFGMTYRVRLFVTDQQRQAIELRQRILSAPPDAQRWGLADACTTGSIHPSASRGGLIPKLSADDPAYPIVLTKAIKATPPGQLSKVLSSDAGYVLLFVEAINPAAAPTPEQIRSVHEQLELRKQRVEMQRLATQLIADAQVTVLDQSLNWSWNDSK